MQKIIEVNLNADKMLSLFAKDTFYKPYRFQSDLRINISFEQYRKFVLICLHNNLDVLHFSFQMYRRALQDDMLLKRIYLLDMSDVILHELFVSCMFNKPSISVEHFFDSASHMISMSACSKLFSTLPESNKDKSFKLLEQDAAFEASKHCELDDCKQTIFSYGMYLRAVSFNKVLDEEFNMIGGIISDT